MDRAAAAERAASGGSLLTVILDATPAAWAAMPASLLPFMACAHALTAFLNAVLLMDRRNAVVVIAHPPCEVLLDTTGSCAAEQAVSAGAAAAPGAADVKPGAAAAAAGGGEAPTVGASWTRSFAGLDDALKARFASFAARALEAHGAAAVVVLPGGA